MSSLDTYIFIGASSLVQGFFNRKKEVIIRYIKYVTILFVGLATIIAILISSLILSSYIFIAFYTVLAIPVLATWMRPKIKPITLSYSFLCGLILAIIGLFLGFYFKMGITPSIVLISIVGSLIGFLIGALVSKFIR